MTMAKAKLTNSDETKPKRVRKAKIEAPVDAESSIETVTVTPKKNNNIDYVCLALASEFLHSLFAISKKDAKREAKNIVAFVYDLNKAIGSRGGYCEYSIPKNLLVTAYPASDQYYISVMLHACDELLTKFSLSANFVIDCDRVLLRVINNKVSKLVLPQGIKSCDIAQYCNNERYYTSDEVIKIKGINVTVSTTIDKTNVLELDSQYRSKLYSQYVQALGNMAIICGLFEDNWKDSRAQAILVRNLIKDGLNSQIAHSVAYCNKELVKS